MIDSKIFRSLLDTNSYST